MKMQYDVFFTKYNDFTSKNTGEVNRIFYFAEIDTGKGFSMFPNRDFQIIGKLKEFCRAKVEVNRIRQSDGTIKEYLSALIFE